jgi:uncharacterized protein (DUF58 family)
VRIERAFPKRGVYPIKGFLIGTRFPLGFIEQRRYIAADGEIVIYPVMKLPEEFLSIIRPAHGRIESRFRGSGTDLHAIRPYLVSDYQHYIDWKATAKTSSLMVREFTRDDDWRVTVVFENRVSAERATQESFNQRFESAIVLAAGLIGHFTGQGAEVRLVAGNNDSGYGLGQLHLFSMLRLLAELAPATQADGDQEWPQQQWFKSGEDQNRIFINPDSDEPVRSNGGLK